MPEPNRPPFLIEENLDSVPFWMLIEQRAVIVFECDACHHCGTWTAETMERLFHNDRGLTLRHVAPRLRCSKPKCHSQWVRISRAYNSRPAAPDGAIQSRAAHQPRG